MGGLWRSGSEERPLPKNHLPCSVGERLHEIRSRYGNRSLPRATPGVGNPGRRYAKGIPYVFGEEFVVQEERSLPTAEHRNTGGCRHKPAMGCTADSPNPGPHQMRNNGARAKGERSPRYRG